MSTSGGFGGFGQGGGFGGSGFGNSGYGQRPQMSNWQMGGQAPWQQKMGLSQLGGNGQMPTQPGPGNNFFHPQPGFGQGGNQYMPQPGNYAGGTPNFNEASGGYQPPQQAPQPPQGMARPMMGGYQQPQPLQGAMMPSRNAVPNVAFNGRGAPALNPLTGQPWGLD